MQDTTHRPGDRVRVFAPGQGHHGMTGTIERTTQLPTRDLWVRLERNGHVVLCMPGELRSPALTMALPARALLAAHRVYRTAMVKTSDNVVGRQRIRRYASGPMLLELTTHVGDSERAGAERISEGFRVRRAADLKALAAMTVQPSPFALALAEAMQQRADSMAPARRAISDPIPAPTRPCRGCGQTECSGCSVGEPCRQDIETRDAAGRRRVATCCADLGHAGTCIPNGTGDIVPETPEVLNDRMRALLLKAGAVIR